MDAVNESTTLICLKGKTEFYLPLKEILFFETDGEKINVHTRDDIYTIKKKLYELEETLPGYFFRSSKSAIVNLNHIYSIEHNISSTSIVSFKGTHKQLFVSRRYYAILKERMASRR